MQQAHLKGAVLLKSWAGICGRKVAYPIVVLPQRSKAYVGPNSHIAKKGHPGILSKPGELIYDILHEPSSSTSAGLSC